MATKKPAKSTKKSAAKKPASRAAQTTTKVTTVKASTGAPKKTKVVKESPVEKNVAAASTAKSEKFSFSRSPLLAASVAEFLGAFLLAAFFLVTQATSLYVLFGLIVLVLTLGVVSGAHFNPAVTLGAWATRRVTSARAASYVVAQVLGAMLALVVVNGFVSAAPQVSAQAAQLGQSGVELYKLAALPDGKEWLVLAAELVGTIIVALAYAAVSKERNRLVAAFGVGGGLFLGLTLASTLVQYIGGTAAVLNPAVAASVQAINWNIMPILVYIAAPIVGGVIGFALHDLLRDESSEIVA